MTAVSAQASLPPTSIAAAPAPAGRQFVPQSLVGVPRCSDQSSRYPLYGPSRWSTLRFRRAKDRKGWVLLGIPLSLYSLVVQRLFEEQAKFIAKYRMGGFVNLLFDAPQTLAATLALTFPAPPGTEPLVVNEKGDRILSGSSVRSEKARTQTIATV